MSRIGDFITNIIDKAFFTDFIKGLNITLKYNLSKSITLRYPDDEKWIPHKRWRGLHTLNKDDKGRELCVACELCAKACPTNCITVVPMEDDTGKGITDRIAKVWTIDLVRCLFCGYCEDACPTKALRLGRGYELSVIDIKGTFKTKKELLQESPEIPDGVEGGVVAKARFVRTDEGIKVIADLGQTKRRKL